VFAWWGGGTPAGACFIRKDVSAGKSALRLRSPEIQPCNLQHGNDLKIHFRGLFTVLAQVKALLLEKQQPRRGRMKVARQVLPGKVKSDR
jgi:hypothetical protein